VRLKLMGASVGLAVLILGVGVAQGLPRSNNLGSHTVKNGKRDDDSPKGSKRPERDDPSKPNEGHGAAVSAAAHCDLKGPAHGAFVSSVATDKKATPVSAAAACKHAGGEQRNGPGNSAWAHRKIHGRSDGSPGNSPNVHSTE
jgi:hypothetical protein